MEKEQHEKAKKAYKWVGDCGECGARTTLEMDYLPVVWTERTNLPCPSCRRTIEFKRRRDV